MYTTPRATHSCEPFKGQTRRRSHRWFVALATLIVAVLFLPLSPASAQSTDVSDAELARLKAELEAEVAADKSAREAHKVEVLEQARVVLAQQGDVADVEEALHQVQGLLTEQRKFVRAAELEVEVAQATVEVAQQRVKDLSELQHELRRRVQELIIQVYIGRDASLEGSLGLARTGDVYEAARIETLVGAVYGDLRTTSDQLHAVEVDAEQAVWEFEAAVERFQVKQQDATYKEEELVESVELQYDFYRQVNNRYESVLYEAQVLQEVDDQLAAEVTDSAKRLGAVLAEENRRTLIRLEQERRARERLVAETLAREGTARAPTSSNVPASELRTIRGIRVHESIYVDLLNLLSAAEDDGITLGGGGYRSYSSQVNLRRFHCGTSQYAIYSKPSSTCRPPTARPGYSMHERGLAIDFTVNGRAITSRNTTAFRWLRNNAGKYGLKNLPSEPWHWSTNGN